MSLLEEIYQGWRNYAFPNARIEEIAKKRAAICAICPKLRPNKVCSSCGCYVPAKTRSPRSRCPLKKW